MRIHIIGGSGSGKSYLANALSKKFGIPHYDLDDLFWDNSANHYGVKTPVEKRDKLFHDIVDQDSWIVEGVYYSWVDDSFDKSDKILVLDIPKHIYKARIIKRFLKRKFRMEHGKKETIKSLIDLLKWTDKFQNQNLPEIYTALSKYKDKVVVLDRVKAINEYIKESRTIS